MLILGRRVHSAKQQIGFSARVRRERKGELITYGGDGHLITIAPTGTGKTSGPVITNALRHPGQLIVLDIKGEVYAATADARRAMGQPVHVLDLRDQPLEGSLNPLDLATCFGGDRVSIARSIAADMIERTGKERDLFWIDWSETMLAGGVGWTLSDCERADRRLSRLFDLYHADDVTYSLAVLLDKKDTKPNAATTAAWASFLQLPSENTRGGVLASTQVHLRLFDSPDVRRVTDTSSLDVQALVNGEPMSLYIIVPPHRLPAYRPILRLWISGLLMALTQRKEIPEHRTLMLVDEIANLGRIESFLTATTLMRSSGLTLWSFWQNMNQLNIYDPQAHTLIDNAGVVQCFGARNGRAAQEFATMVGGVSGETVLNLGPRDQLLLMEGGRPVRCQQVRHYEDREFVGPGGSRIGSSEKVRESR